MREYNIQKPSTLLLLAEKDPSRALRTFISSLEPERDAVGVACGARIGVHFTPMRQDECHMWGHMLGSPDIRSLTLQGLSAAACSFCSLACTSRLFDPWAVGTRGLLPSSSDPHSPLPSIHSVQSVQARVVQLTATRHTGLRVPSHPHVERDASSPAPWHRGLRRCLALSSLHTRTASAASNTLPGRRQAMRLSFSFS